MAGACFGGPLWYCGGAFPQPSNLCVIDACVLDTDCTGGNFGVCVVAGAFGEYAAVCSYGDCRFDSDCTSRAGGECRPFFSPCNGRMLGFACTYDDSVCRADADCPGQYCAADTDGVTSCETFIPPP